jgi:hypothetical protein
LRILKENLQRLIHRIERGGFVQQQKIHGLQAELTQAGLQAEQTVTSGEIPAHYAATVETANQRSYTWCQLQDPPKTALALDRGGWGMGLTETALGSHRKMARMAAQQGTNLAFHLAKTVEAGHIEMADAKIDDEI